MNKTKKSTFFPFGKGSSCGVRPYKKTYYARTQRRRKTGFFGLLKRFIKGVLLFSKVAVLSGIIIGVTILLEDFYKNFINLQDFLTKDVVVTGNFFVPREDILKKADIARNDNLLQLNLEEIAGKIKEISVIKSANIRGTRPLLP